MKHTARVKLSRADVWDLLFCRGRSAGSWFGESARFDPIPGSQARLTDRQVAWRRMTVHDVDHHVGVDFRHTATDSSPSSYSAVVTMESKDNGPKGPRTLVSVVTTEPEGASDFGQFWNDRLNDLVGLGQQLARRRDHPRQALVVIHGVGEQEPGRTISKLVDSGALGFTPDKSDPQAWIKPDRDSDLLELRKWTIKAQGREQPTTDVFEMYWAHMMEGTQASHITAWIRRLFLRAPWTVPGRFLPLWFLGWLIVVSFVVVGSLHAIGLIDAAEYLSRYAAAGGVILVLGFLWRAGGKGMTLSVVGDAARYLTPRPTNIAQRQSIRQAGVDLLHRLHTSGEFDRIIILGHSLGSIIAYDVIGHYWHLAAAPKHNMEEMRSDSVHAMEKALADRLPDGTDNMANGVEEVDLGRRLQHDSWKEARRNSVPWLVTDLVTVGSPLAHGRFLLARNHREFETLVTQRILPKAPPIHGRNKVGHLKLSYRSNFESWDGTSRQVSMFHHAAPFAMTRWTNLYFPWWSDPIAGTVAGTFGPWVCDVPLPGCFLGHTKYWNDAAKAAQLRKALNLDAGFELRTLLSQLRPTVLRK